jgi:zinc D-Ala-D-Ala carboxypeptidase
MNKYYVSREASITENFHGAEAFTTSQRISNIIPEDNFDTVSRNIHLTAHRMEEVRKILNNNSITINSWYRSPQLNMLVGGSKNSDHMLGAAVDFVCPKFGTPLEICNSLLNCQFLSWKQLIFEHTWVHISFDFSIPYTPAKLQVLTLLADGKYAVGLTNKSGFKL